MTQGVTNPVDTPVWGWVSHHGAVLPLFALTVSTTLPYHTSVRAYVRIHVCVCARM